MNEPTTTRTPTPGDIEAVEAHLLDETQVAMPVTHRFAPGIYWREFFVPAGTFVIGHEHKTEHLNVMLTGRMSVIKDGELIELTAPCVFLSEAGERKFAIVQEAMRYATVHPLAGLEACGQDIARIEDCLRRKSDTFVKHEQKQLEAK